MVNDLNNEKKVDLLYYMMKPETLDDASNSRMIKEYIDKMMEIEGNLTINELEKQS